MDKYAELLRSCSWPSTRIRDEQGGADISETKKGANKIDSLGQAKPTDPIAVAALSFKLFAEK